MAALYQLAWEDTFGGTALDRAKWNVRIGNWSISEDGTPLAPGWGNNEQQYYRDDAQNLFVGNDRLTIRALRQTSPVQFGQRVPYTSAKIDTRGLFSFCYGKVEFRARCPLGTGLWPAVWMMPEDHVYGPWARSGEIDILEAMGRCPDLVCGTIHYGGPPKTRPSKVIPIGFRSAQQFMTSIPTPCFGSRCGCNGMWTAFVIAAYQLGDPAPVLSRSSLSPSHLTRNFI